MTSADKHYDIIIIGSGSGNSFPTEEFADRSIALIDDNPRFGGTCLNSGCIPTKMFVVAADAAAAPAEAERLGVHTTFEGADWPAIVNRVFTQRVDIISRDGEAYRRGEESPNITFYNGRASFVGPKTLTTAIDGEPATISGDTILIAAGSRPFIPPVIEESGVPYLTNETVMRLPEQPESLTILGGGYIAMEFAHVFQSLGTHVRIVNRSPLMRHLDKDIHDRFHAQAAPRYETHLGRVVESAAASSGSGKDSVTLTLDDGTTVTSSALLVATGRVPNGDLLNLSASGIEEENGRVVVDKHGRTTCEGVWAVGDVSSPYMLKHVANAELRAVRHNIAVVERGDEEQMIPLPHDNVPSAVFTYPQLASVGLTEQQAIDAGYDVTCKIQSYGDVAYGWAMEDTTSAVKLIADRQTARLLGAHYMGPQAATLLQQVVTIMAFDLDLRDVARRQYWTHPALSEVTENAILGLDFEFPPA